MTVSEQIQALMKQGRPKGNSGIDPTTGMPVDARSPTAPALILARQAAANPLNPNPDAPGAARVTPQTIGQTFTAPDPAYRAQQDVNQTLADQEKNRLRGRASTLIAGSTTGLLGSPTVSRRSLLGF